MSALQQLWKASKAGDLPAVQRALAEGADVHYDDETKGWTPLHRACYHGHLEIIRALLDAGAKPNEAKTRGTGQSPLIFACQKGRVEAARMLLDAGAEIDAVDNDGHTPLAHACSRGKLEVVKELLKRGADLSKKDNENETAFDWAYQNSKQSVVDHLLQHYQESVVRISRQSFASRIAPRGQVRGWLDSSSYWETHHGPCDLHLVGSRFEGANLYLCKEQQRRLTNSCRMPIRIADGCDSLPGRTRLLHPSNSRQQR